MSVTVITPSLPSRANLLAESCRSVAAQERPPDAHLIGIDHRREGSAANRNRLVRAATTDWLALDRKSVV